MIKIILTSSNKQIGKEELNGLFTRPNDNRPQLSNASKSKEMTYTVGTPVFCNLPFKSNDQVIVPAEQCNIAADVLKSVKTKKQMIETLKAEYKSIISALHILGINFHVLNLDAGDEEIRHRVTTMGYTSLKFPHVQPNRWTMYPRDMFLYIRSINTLLVHSQLFNLPKYSEKECEIIHSIWAEGGRVLLAGDRMLIGGYPEALGRTKERKVINRLRDKGMKISTIPYALSCRISGRNSKPRALYYDKHIDRSASLLLGKNGDYQLIIDPTYRTGPLISPFSVKKSLEIVRAACGKIQVQVNIPRSITQPYASSVVQFENGKVLATGNDHGIYESLSDIAGPGNISSTDIPIKTYPIFTSAGIHCLITETPIPLVST